MTHFFQRGSISRRFLPKQHFWLGTNHSDTWATGNTAHPNPACWLAKDNMADGPGNRRQVWYPVVLAKADMWMVAAMRVSRCHQADSRCFFALAWNVNHVRLILVTTTQSSQDSSHNISILRRQDDAVLVSMWISSPSQMAPLGQTMSENGKCYFVVPWRTGFLSFDLSVHKIYSCLEGII